MTTTSDRAALASLRKRFPGFEASMGRAVHDMAEMLEEHRPVRSWTEVQCKDPHDILPSGWIAYVHCVITETKQEIRVPVIPDEFNPHPTKLVRETDEPYVFKYMSEAEQTAEAARCELEKYVRSKL